MNKVAAFLILSTLVGCGPRATGAIGQACIAADRQAATPALCSCVQQVANQTLSNADQRRAVAFFAEPDLAQSTRQADGSANEAFWDRYTAFAETARRSCG